MIRRLVEIDRAEGEVMPVSKVTWRQVGHVTEPGRYMLPFGWVTITPADLAIWEAFPDASFTLLPQVEAADEYRLGSFDLASAPPFELGPRD